MSDSNGLRSSLPYFAIIAVAVIAVFANTLSGEFVYDDRRQIAANPLIQESERYPTALVSDAWAFKGDGAIAASNYWRPTFTAWSILNFALFGTEPLGWHITNVLLHLAVCLVAFVLLRRWGVPRLWAGLGVLVFAVHPVHTESVAWVSGSPDLLFALFLLGSLYFADRLAASDDSKHGAFLAAAVGLYFLALGAKETALLCLPIFPALFAIRSTREKGESRYRASFRGLRSSVPFAIAAAAYFLARMAVLGGIARPVEDAAPTASVVFSAPMLFLFYLRQMVFPYWLGPNHAVRPVEWSDPSLFVLPFLASLAIVVGLLFVLRGSHIGLIGLMLFFAPLVPAFFVSAFPREQIAHDRYLYLPLLGFIIVIGTAAYRILSVNFSRYERPMAAAVSILIAVLGVRTFAYNVAWQNETALWSHAVEVDPGSAFTWSQLGSALTEQAGREPEALKAYERSIRIRPTALALMGRARNLTTTGRHAEAVAEVDKILEMPLEETNAYTLFQAYEVKAIALQQMGRAAEAIAMLDEARGILPIYRAALTEKIGVLLYTQGKKGEALAELERVRPRVAGENLGASKLVYLRLGLLYAELGRHAEARREFQMFLNSTENLAGAEMDNYRKEAARALAAMGGK